jgi:hypothetical protein
MKTDGAGLCFGGFLNLVDTHEENTPVGRADANERWDSQEHSGRIDLFDKNRDNEGGT